MLIATESAEEFTKTRDEFLEDIQPEGAIERRYAEDVAYLTWELRRYRKSKAGIINAALFDALQEILKQVVPRYKTNMDVPLRLLMIERLARGWFDNKEAKAEVMKLLRSFGLDETTIAAEAFRSRMEDIEECDRMEALAEARREKALRFIGKLRKSLGIQLRRSSNRMLDKEEAPTLVPVADGSD
jgi:hypothetical protein